MNVVTIIANAEFHLDESEIGTIVDSLQNNGAIIENVNWLAEGVACDIFFAVLNIDEADYLLGEMLANVPVDFIVQSKHGRKKKLLICDMDSTIIEQECIDELADFAGLKEKVSVITAAAMNGELDFSEALRERVMLLKGLEESVLEQVYRDNITFTSGAKELVSTMKQNGATCILVSGGFTFFTGRVKNDIGFDVEEANILEIENGILTGKVREPILDKEAKLNTLQLYVEELGIDIGSTIAIGDGANDLPMIECCNKGGGLGIAYHAKPAVRRESRFKIDSCDLKALLYAQGYKLC